MKPFYWIAPTVLFLLLVATLTLRSPVYQVPDNTFPIVVTVWYPVDVQQKIATSLGTVARSCKWLFSQYGEPVTPHNIIYLADPDDEFARHHCLVNLPLDWIEDVSDNQDAVDNAIKAWQAEFGGQ
jgi:hypothetical protein